MPKVITGIIPIVAAPFDEQGGLDPDSFQSLVRHLVKTGAPALTLFGLASEFYKLSDADRACLQTLLLNETSRSDTTAGIISITEHSRETAVPRARAAEEEGADALMVLPPFFLAPSEDAILEHLRQVIGSVKIPIIVQYAPAQTGVRIAPDVFARLSGEFENEIFIKVETQPPGRYISSLKERSGGRVKALVGYAGVQMPDTLARGAVGIQPGCSFTEIYLELWRRWHYDRASFQALFEGLLPYTSYWMQGIELIIKAEKVILKERGIIASDYCRSPSYALDEGERGVIQDFLREFAGLLG